LRLHGHVKFIGKSAVAKGGLPRRSRVIYIYHNQSSVLCAFIFIAGEIEIELVAGRAKGPTRHAWLVASQAAKTLFSPGRTLTVEESEYALEIWW
jgi:hypothetical protein